MLRPTMTCRDRMPLVAVWLVVVAGTSLVPVFGQDSERLVEQEPFDRIVLDEENKNSILNVLPLGAAVRPEGADRPKTGMLQFRLVDSPAIHYQVPWKNVAAIRRYEDLLFEEGQKLASGGKFDEAYDYFAYLKTHYPELPGLAGARPIPLSARVRSV